MRSEFMCLIFTFITRNSHCFIRFIVSEFIVPRDCTYNCSSSTTTTIRFAESTYKIKKTTGITPTVIIRFNVVCAIGAIAEDK